MKKTIFTLLIFIFFSSPFLKTANASDDPETGPGRYTMEISSNGTADLYKISLNLPRTSFVRLTLTDEKGKTVKKLINENIRSGKYDLVFDAKNLAKGRYNLNFYAKDHSESRELTVQSSR